MRAVNRQPWFPRERLVETVFRFELQRCGDVTGTLIGRNFSRIVKCLWKLKMVLALNLHARGKPSTMVSARTACRDGSSNNFEKYHMFIENSTFVTEPRDLGST